MRIEQQRHIEQLHEHVHANAHNGSVCAAEQLISVLFVYMYHYYTGAGYVHVHQSRCLSRYVLLSTLICFSSMIYAVSMTQQLPATPRSLVFHYSKSDTAALTHTC
jgi:hypothetical protein